jgi:hypothetical protein
MVSAMVFIPLRSLANNSNNGNPYHTNDCTEQPHLEPPLDPV